MERDELSERALTREELDSLKVPMDEYDDITEYSEDMTEWYNEAVWTAAELFVQAAEQSDTFREWFMSQETKPVEVGDSSVEMEVWRSTLEKELPEYHEKIMGIGLSAFQGGSAESVAREVLA